MKQLIPLLIISALAIGMNGCAPKAEGASEMDYEKTKKMVVDILKTDEGKTALQEVLKEDQMKQNLVMDQKMVSETITKTLTSKQGIQFWTKIFEDPKFSEAFAQSLQKEHEKVIKQLMADPDYQKMMIEILQNPEMEKEIGTVIKSQESRKYIQEVITETLTSPLYKMKMQEALLKAAQQMGQQSEGGGQQQGGAGGSESGGSSESGGGSGGQ
ncbi:spore gernimation protein GerD [Bacillus sp. FJAT-42376]|uniref:spore germination lipoprotein GerD n=1 Tax=Bacillus sp. FJAT-42376 TaxID=2014076 RepID=UPI000F5151CC|nr:spore germination lipoprotein GerD [Bacillus sp. FJAT-42376]AZB41293.1 spore gernimation protein GerD [Bacillus sp. FJAT-42376]